MLELKNINKTYISKQTNSTEALKNINISFNHTGLTFILGKSGCGKSTLLNILGGLDIPSDGEIIFKGKSFSSFKSSDYDSYRNTEIGFVFQEYNLIEKYDVFDNVAYALHLQTSKIDENIILNVLEKVGLKELAKRKVNELSGGQKQRVAIARALVKNPSIILADEPTGNLDSESSQMIFDILKSLSYERLVIVVSHDEESAKTYADRIIRLQDGCVIGDTNPNIVQEESKYILKKNKLPFKEALKFAIKNIFGHKIKLLLSIILIAFSLSFLGFAIMQNNLRSNKEIERIIKDYDINYLIVEKLEDKYSQCALKGYWYNCYNTGYFTEEEYQKLTNERKIPIEKRYYFTIGKTYISRDLLEEEYPDISYYYSHYRIGRLFTELKKEEFNFKLIGNIPKNYSEIVIIKPLADFILEYGINIYNELGEIEVYKPNNYEELITSRKELQLGQGKVIVSGIIDDDLSEFNDLKNISQDDVSEENLTIEQKRLIDKYRYKYPVHFYALDGFKDEIDLKQNNTRYFTLGQNEDVNQIKLFEPMKVYTENGFVKIEKLETDGVIVNSKYLDKISNGEFTKKLNEYIINGKDNDPSKSSEEYKEEFVTNYIKENEITNKIVSLSLVKFYDDKENNDILNIRIIGIVLDDEFFYTNENILNKNSDDKYKFQVYVLTDKITNYDNLFDDYPIDGEKYIVTNDFMMSIAGHEFTMKILAKYIFIIGLIFSLFAVLVLFNFLGLSITDNKKEIGILRALGTTKRDVTKIYSIQGLLIGFISYLISIVLSIFYVKVENDIILGKFLKEVYNVSIFGITFDSLFIMFIFFVVVVLLSVLSVSNKISKMKPIDAINNK